MSRHSSDTVIAALLLHGAVLASAAARHAPVLDEVAHLPAGISHWQFGRFDLYRANPPLVRTVAALPVCLAGAKTESVQFSDAPGYRAEFPVARDFMESNGQQSFWYFALGRWTLIPFSLFGAWICYRWAKELYGAAAGVLALTLWCFSPNILANAHLITPDAGATAVGVCACYLFWRWLKEPTWGWTLAAGIVLGLAQLTKMTWVVLFGLWPALWILYRWLEKRERAGFPREGEAPAEPPIAGNGSAGASPSHLRQFGMIGAMMLFALCVLNLGYAFEGTLTRLGDYQFVSETLRGEHTAPDSNGRWGNRFAGTWLAGVPVPLPRNYLLGIDVVKEAFEMNRLAYLAGEFRNGGWWYYYLYALAVKVPLGTWVLVLLALWMSLSRTLGRERSAESGEPELGNSGVRGQESGVSDRQRTTDNGGPSTLNPPLRDTLVVVVPLIVILTFVSANSGINRHLRYVLPIFPFAFIWIGQVARSFERRQWRIAMIVAAALAWSVGSSLWVYPHSGSYFNELAGGPKNGHAHLICSNIDWGQDLLYLKRWLDEHSEARPLHLAYYGGFDPRVAGIEFSVPPRGPRRGDSHEQTPPESLGPQPGWHAISVHLLRQSQSRIDDGRGGRVQLELGDYDYFLKFEPRAMAGYSIYIYHISLDEANRVRRELGLRPVGAAAGL